MTVHNLGANLSWLLQQSPCLHLPLEYSTISEPSSQHVYHTPEEEVFLEAPARRASIESQQGADETDHMARLQLAPQAMPKPTLVTHQKTQHPLPTPAASRSTVEPLSSRHNVPTLPPSVKRQPPTPRTPTTNYDDSAFDGMGSEIFDIDDIDFAGADFTTSSFDSFGLPKTLWTEDAASRADPLPSKNGKKRKSEEYQEDLLSAKQSQRAMKRTLYSIPQHKASPLAEYGSQQTIKARSPKQVAKPVQPFATARQTEEPQEPVDYDEEFRITETTIRTETRRSRSSGQLQRPRDRKSVV